jgi:hemin uptake protein HemP
MIGKDTDPRKSVHTKAPAESAPRDERVIESGTLFAGQRQVRITHNGESYSLRLTRLGKLILTK